MKPLQKPQRLQKGDTVATVSLSSGIAGRDDVLWRYNQGKKRLEEVFGLHVVEMPHTLSGIEYVYQHPEKRAQDLMDAFADPKIKAIISCTGGNESIRLHPHINYDVIAQNPKLYSGYSDSTITHLMCFKAGLSSLYGPSILSDFAENLEMSPYTVEWINKLWFTPQAPGSVPTSPTYTAQHLKWLEENKYTARQFQPNDGYALVQGTGKAIGRLFGGCFEIIDMVKGTPLMPAPEEINGCILFLETSEEQPPAWLFEDTLRGLATSGHLAAANGILLAKPMGGKWQAEYHTILKTVLAENGQETLPVLGNASFGHNEPKFPLPYGALAEIDCDAKSFSILESGVQ